MVEGAFNHPITERVEGKFCPPIWKIFLYVKICNRIDEKYLYSDIKEKELIRWGNFGSHEEGEAVLAESFRYSSRVYERGPVK